jgi:hypothetical protein
MMDIRMKDMDGLAATRQIINTWFLRIGVEAGWNYSPGQVSG